MVSVCNGLADDYRRLLAGQHEPNTGLAVFPLVRFELNEGFMCSVGRASKVKE